MSLGYGRLPRRGPLRKLALALESRLPFDLGALYRRSSGAFKEALGVAVRFGGLSLVAQHTYHRGKVGILVYHNPSPAGLERHLAFLSHRYRFVSLDALVEALRTGDWSAIPPRSLVVTFDDGHRGNRELLGAFERYRIVPTIFVCTQIVGTRRRFWWTAVDAPTRHRLYRVSNRERLEFLRDRGFDLEAEPDGGAPQALGAEDVRRMLPAVDFQPHTRFHPLLPTCDDAEAELEIRGSRHELERLTGREGRHFSYPHGLYGERDVALVKGSGYESARTFTGGFNGPGTDPYRLRAVGVRDDASLNLLAAALALPRLSPL